MKLIHEIERRIEERLRRIFASSGTQEQQTASSGPELIEIQKQVLDAVLGKVQSLPRARRAFPFNDVIVKIAAADPDRRALLEAVFVQDGVLAHEIQEALRQDDVEYPRDIKIDVQILAATDTEVPLITCRRLERDAPPKKQDPSRRPHVSWVLPDGSRIESDGQRVYLGRTPEVLDDRKRLIRRNDVVTPGDTVSRGHAHLEWDAAAGTYRIFDDGSSYGTSVLHNGRLADLAKAGARGFALSSGDEIYLGRERLRFELAATEPD